MTKLIVIRHGETDWNRQHRFQGQIDVPLNALGLEQARRLGLRLAREPIDLLVVSDRLHVADWTDAGHLADLPPQPRMVQTRATDPASDPASARVSTQAPDTVVR